MLPLHKGCYLFPPCCLISAVWLWLFDFSVWPSPSVLLAAFCLIYDSLELMVQNQDLCPWCCDWIGAGSLASSRLSLSISLSLPLLLSLSLSLSLSRSLARSLPLDEVSDGVRWPVSDSAVDQCPRAPSHSSSLHPPLLLSARATRLHAGGRADSPSDKATRPRLTFHPFSSLLLPRPFLPHTQTHTLTLTHTSSPGSLSLCVGAEDRGQAAWQAGGLVCGTVLISTGIWRRKPRYLPAQPFSSKPPSSRSFFLFPSLYVSGGCFHHAACVARFVKDVAASCLFHGRLPTSPHIFRPLSFPRLFPSLSLFLSFPPPSLVYLLMNSVS